MKRGVVVKNAGFGMLQKNKAVTIARRIII
jgi:hypothetical protein